MTALSLTEMQEENTHMATHSLIIAIRPKLEAYHHAVLEGKMSTSCRVEAKKKARLRVNRETKDKR